MATIIRENEYDISEILTLRAVKGSELTHDEMDQNMRLLGFGMRYHHLFDEGGVSGLLMAAKNIVRIDPGVTTASIPAYDGFVAIDTGYNRVDPSAGLRITADSQDVNHVFFTYELTKDERDDIGNPNVETSGSTTIDLLAKKSGVLVIFIGAGANEVVNLTLSEEPLGEEG